MNKVLQIVDDFLPDPLKIRNEVIARGFRDAEFENTTYNTVNPDYRPADMARGLSLIYGRPIQMHVQAFRQGKLGSSLHNLVHADNTCATTAAVLYLNLPENCKGGTAFWKHKQTGWEHQPTDSQLQEAGITIEEFARDWHIPQAWDMTTLAGMAFNRLITYPTTMFHSRWPWNGFGDNDENARLIWCGFFDLL